MQDDYPTPAEVVAATSEDKAVVVAWLKAEYEEDGKGFWCNHNLIEGASEGSGHLWVIRREGVAVAFQLGRYSASILSVRKSYRNNGLGRALVEASVDRATSDDVNVLSVECEPQESLGFWARMGFVQVEETGHTGTVRAHRFLPRTFNLPEAAFLVNVVIGFYPESAAYQASERGRPHKECRVVGAYLGDGSIMLEERVVGLSHYGGDNRDTVVRVEAGGVIYCFCKAKYERAQLVGLKRDWVSGAYFIDRINRIE